MDLALFRRALDARAASVLDVETARASLGVRAHQSIRAKWAMWLFGSGTTWALWGDLPPLHLVAWFLPLALMAEVNWRVCRRVVARLPDAQAPQLREMELTLWWISTVNQALAGSTVWWFGAGENMGLAALATALQLVYVGGAMINASTHPPTFVTGAFINLFAAALFWLVQDGQHLPLVLSLVSAGLLLTRLSRQMADNLRESIRMRFEKQELLDQLAAEKKVAEEATQFKSAFLANISHEVRTPVSAIKGMTYLALKSELTPRQRDYLNVIQQCSEHLHGLINQVLDFSKVEASMLTLERTPFALSQVLDTVHAMHADRAIAKGLTLRVNRAPGVPDRLVGDPLRLTEILVNFVSNAIKFTETGHVVVDVTVRDQRPGRVKLQVSVQDTGIGLTADQMARLFQSFSQADASTPRKYGGTGLGLAIAKKLAELMDGEVGAHSEAGAGSTFWFNAWFDRPDPAMGPQAATATATAMASSTSVPPSGVVAPESAADPGPAAAATGCAGKVGGPGDAALPPAADAPASGSWRESAPPSERLLAARRPPRGPDQRPATTWAQALAGFAQDDDPRCVAHLNAHADALAEHLGAAYGPLERAVLAYRLPEATRLLHSLGYANAQATTAPPPDDRACVLVVDDTPVNLTLMADLLGDRYRVRVATSGERALAIATSATPPDLVLLDVNMPGWDGYDTLRQLKQHAACAAIPVLFVTARTQLADEERALALGAVDFITKPISPPLVRQRVQTHLALARAQRV